MRFRKPTLYKKRKTRNKRIKTRRKMRRYMGGGLDSSQIEAIETSIRNVKEQIIKYKTHIEYYKLLEELRIVLDANYKTINSNSMYSRAKKNVTRLLRMPGTNELQKKTMEEITEIKARIDANPVQSITDFEASVKNMWRGAFDPPDNAEEVVTEEDNTLKEKELKDKVLKTYTDAMYTKNILDTYQDKAKYYTSTHEDDGTPKKVIFKPDKYDYSVGRGDTNN